jgi:hypothetical protein
MSGTNVSMPQWYELAREKCLASEKSEELLRALNKGFDIIQENSASEPVVFVLESDCGCEFKWPKTIIYTFGNSHPDFFLVHDGYSFVERTPYNLDFSE